MITIEMSVATYDDTLPMNVASSEETIGMNIGASYSMSNADPFEGSYEYTPSEQTQTIPIEDLRATQDIVINPIPSNYGLITWDGITLTVS